MWVELIHADNCEARRRGNEERFVEFQVCLQNIRSRSDPIPIDLSRAQLHFWGDRRMHRPMHSEPLNDKGIMTLESLEFQVVTLRFPCSIDRLETDFLSRLYFLQVPLADGGSSVVEAISMPESHYWKCYSELPGGCLTFSANRLLMNI